MRSSSRLLSTSCLALLLWTLRPAHCAVALTPPVANDSPALSSADVTQILQQGIAFLKTAGASGLLCVTDREGHILAQYRMNTTASPDIRISEQASTKARTAAFLVSDQDAFTTRTAQFIVQSHFPPGLTNFGGGPLFGVPFSSLPASDGELQQPPFIVFINGVNAPTGVPAGNPDTRPTDQPFILTPLTDDLGGVPLFKKVGKVFQAAGGVGVEIDGFGVVANGVPDTGFKTGDPSAVSKAQLEEQAALAAQTGFAPPSAIRADKILVNGFRFPYAAKSAPRVSGASSINLATEGTFEPVFDTDGSERDPDGSSGSVVPYAAVNPQGMIVAAAAQPRATPEQEFPKQGWVPRFPPRDTPLGDGSLVASDVQTICQQAADQAFSTRAAIRRPIGVPAEVFIAVVDRTGNLCGVFRTSDATIFSFDVAVQKARTAAFLSTAAVAFSTRTAGFLAQTLYPPGIDASSPGPLSGLLPLSPQAVAGQLSGTGSGVLRQISEILTDDGVAFVPTTLSAAVKLLSRRMTHVDDGRLSPLQVAISVDLTLGRPSDGAAPPPTELVNGLTLFPGGVPLYKNGVLVGAVGVSGDGVDQDDVIAYAGSLGLRPPAGVRCDQASGATVITALQAALSKLKTEFPNLTNGTDAVLDVIDANLQKGPAVLQGLRLPYVKLPRSLGK
jgi:uncharacterized protein GlcG (DUF336 family)